MIVSDKYGFIIATPTKNGTTTLQAMANKWLRDGGASSVLRVYRGASETKHRIAPPDDREAHDRFIVIRDPRSRLPSMYEWLRRRPKDEPLGEAILLAESKGCTRKAGWIAMVQMFDMIRSAEDYYTPGARRLGARRPFMWTDNQTELWNFLHGYDADGDFLPWYRETDTPGLLRTETLEADWWELLELYDVDEDDLFELPVKQLNSTKRESRIANGWEEYRALLPVPGRRLFDKLVDEDMNNFQYY